MYVRNSELVKMVELVTGFAKEAASNAITNEGGNDSRNPIVKYAHLVNKACSVVESMPETVMQFKELLQQIEKLKDNDSSLLLKDAFGVEIKEHLDRLTETIGDLVNDTTITPTLDKSSIARYISGDGKSCPYCESANISFGEMYVDEDKDISQKITCDECTNSWGEVYKIATIKPFTDDKVITSAASFEDLDSIIGDNHEI